MKSTLKVTYESRFDSNLNFFAPKEPVIKIELERSDDPRDILIEEVLGRSIYPNLGTMKVQAYEATIKTNKEVFLIYRKNRAEELCDIALNVYLTLTYFHPKNLKLITTDDRFFFEVEETKNRKKASAGINRQEFEGKSDIDFRTALIEDFKDFVK